MTFWDTFFGLFKPSKKGSFWKNMIKPNNSKTPNNFEETDFKIFFKMTLVERYHHRLLAVRLHCLVGGWNNVPSLLNFVNFQFSISTFQFSISEISKFNFDFPNSASQIRLPKIVLQKKFLKLKFSVFGKTSIGWNTDEENVGKLFSI